MALESQIATVGVEHNASLRQKLEELATVVDRLDARHALRQRDGSAALEMGIYESCVSALPDLSQANGDLLDCPACESRHQGHGAGIVPAASLVPPWIRAEVDWRRQHTEVLNQRIEVLEREKSLWEQKLRKLRSNSPGTSARNKIFQLFPKEPPVASHADDSTPQSVHTAHAWSVGPAALKGTAREVYEKMLNPQPLQFIHPAPKPERQKLQEERAVEAERQQQEDLRAQEEQLQAELGQQMTNRQELRSALSRELQAMRCLEAERQRQREATRAKLQDELHQHLREERRAWQVEQERQDVQRREAHQKRTEVHQEMQRLELERLIDKLTLKRSCQVQPPASFNEEKLLELWKLRLAKDPQQAPELSKESKQIQVCDDLPVELLGMEEWLLFYGDLLNGTSRDKLLDIEVLEHAFLLLSNSQPTLDPKNLHEATDFAVPGVVMMMLSYWLQHCQATWQRSKETGASNLSGAEDSVPSLLPAENAPLQQPFDELTLSSTQPDENSNPTDHMLHTNTGTDDAGKPVKNKQTAWASARPSQASRTADGRPEVSEPGLWHADVTHSQHSTDHSRSSEKQEQTMGEIDHPAEFAHPGHEAFLTRSIPARHVSDSSVVVNERSIPRQQTRASLDSSLPMRRHADDMWEPASEEVAETSKAAHVARAAAAAGITSLADDANPPLGSARTSGASVPRHSKRTTDQLQAAPADDAQTSAAHQSISVAGSGHQASGSLRPSRASLPQDSKQTAGSAAASAGVATTAEGDHGTSVACGGKHQDDGWGPDGWDSARPSQASVLEDGKPRADQPDASLADDAQTSAAGQRIGSHGREAAIATQHTGIDQETDEEASEDEVFTKEQWTEWFKTADLEEAELQLLQHALQHLSPQQQLSPEEMAEALRAHGCREAVPEEEADQLREWAQWALEINDSD